MASSRPSANCSTLATLIGSITLTLILWVVGYLVMGGPR